MVPGGVMLAGIAAPPSRSVHSVPQGSDSQEQADGTCPRGFSEALPSQNPMGDLAVCCPQPRLQLQPLPAPGRSKCSFSTELCHGVLDILHGSVLANLNTATVLGGADIPEYPTLGAWMVLP